MNSPWPHCQALLMRAISARFVLLLLSLPIAAVATTYYLDNQNGNDSNNGLAPSAAWQTIDRANQQPYAPGDAILLRRGGQWHGTGFKANGSGTTNAPILLADYGDLSLPLP